MKKIIIILLMLISIERTFAYSISSSLGTNVCYGQTTTLTLLMSNGTVYNSSSVTWYTSAPTTANECSIQAGAGKCVTT